MRLITSTSAEGVRCRGTRFPCLFATIGAGTRFTYHEIYCGGQFGRSLLVHAYGALKMPQHNQEIVRDFAKDVACTLRRAGFEALWAGGCVRDELLGRIPKDYDVATNAQPDDVREVFAEKSIYAIPVGEAFGVLCVVDPKNKCQVEVASFRSDGAYLDGRRPVNVTFSTAEQDAQRRDFTINGLFFDPANGDYFDYVEGKVDIDRRVVRAIGDPEARFSEDKLRILRAIRFTACLDFDLEEATRNAVTKMAGQIRVVSAERITGEMRLMLTDPHRSRALQLLRDCGLLEILFEEAYRRPTKQIWEEMLAIGEQLSKPSFPLTLAILFSAVTDATAIKNIGQRWRLSNQQAERTAWLAESLESLQKARTKNWPQLQRILIHEGSGELLQLLGARVACNLADEEDLAFCRERLTWPAADLNPPPLLNGNDLAAHGLRPGKRYRELLVAIRDAQLLKQIRSRDEALRLIDQLLDTSGEEPL